MIRMEMVFVMRLRLLVVRIIQLVIIMSAATDAGSCSFPIDLYPSLNVDGVSYVDCDGNCNNDTDGDGVCNEVEISGCTDGDINTNGGLHVIMMKLLLMMMALVNIVLVQDV